MLKIHQITHLFYPDELAGASLYTDLARYLRDRGHDVRVTTTFSYYPALRYSESDKGIAFRDETFEGIPIRRVGMYLPNQHSGFRRLLPELSYVIKLSRFGRFAGWTPDVVITACPMLSQFTVQRWMYPRDIPKLGIVQDLMVDAALELGILRFQGIALLLRWFERYSLGAIDQLATISEGMCAKLQRQLAPGKTAMVCPNWIHDSLARRAKATTDIPAPRDNALLFYSGNLGVKQGLPDFVTTFGISNHGWRLQVNGGGAESTVLKASVGQLPNVSIGPLLTEGEYFDRISSASAALITQRTGASANFMPSKVLPALATGTPVLAVCDHDSPLANEVRAGDFGRVIPFGDRTALEKVLTEWNVRPLELQRLGRNALAWSERFSRETILSRYHDKITVLVQGHKKLRVAG
jgi:colanic acid biosynthesis glycosyl transferase WcaI